MLSLFPIVVNDSQQQYISSVLAYGAASPHALKML